MSPTLYSTQHIFCLNQCVSWLCLTHQPSPCHQCHFQLPLFSCQLAYSQILPAVNTLFSHQFIKSKLGPLWDLLCPMEGNPSLPLERSCFRGREVPTGAGCRNTLNRESINMKNWIQSSWEPSGETFIKSATKMTQAFLYHSPRWVGPRKHTRGSSSYDFAQIPETLKISIFLLLSMKISPKLPSRLIFRLSSSWYHLYQESKPLKLLVVWTRKQIVELSRKKRA